MARMLCKLEDCDNIGEELFFKYCEDNLDNDIVVYHNRYLNGLQFDYCLLVPQYGVLLVEVKGWKKATYKGYQNGKLIIKTEEKTCDQDPYGQVRLYKNIMENLLLNKLGWKPLIERCVCFTAWDDSFFQEHPEIEAYMGHSRRQLLGMDDISEKTRFRQKIQDVFFPNMRESNYFSDDQMIKIMDFFDPGYARSVLERERKEHPITPEGKKEEERKPEDTPTAKDIPPYSIAAVVPAGAFDQVDRLTEYYGQGTKITVVFCGEDLQERAASNLTKLYQQYAIVPDGSEHLKMSRESVTIKNGKGIRLFNWNSHVIASNNELYGKSLFVVDGKTQGEDSVILQKIDNQGMMNLAQYQVEHEDDLKHILVRAGAGTGKTAVMIDRIAYLIYRHQMAPGELRDRIVMITFTDAAAENMSKRLKKRFQDLYLLTGQGEYLAMVGQVNQMQISTIHSFALRLIQKLCVYSGYSNELAVESGQYNRRRFLREALEAKIEEKLKSDKRFISKLGFPFYEIREKLLGFVEALENKSIDLTKLDADSFGVSNDYPELHQLFMEVIPMAEKAYMEELKENGKIFLGKLMPELVNTVKAGKDHNRLQEGETKWERYLFVDEFQDTDDYQIEVILDIVNNMQYHLFCVGDQKQCIYRFRGAEVQAFAKLRIEENPQEWVQHSLVHNYRTDNELLEAFEPYFDRWGQDSRNLLIYDAVNDKMDDPVHSNGGRIPLEDYMHRIRVQDQDAVMPALFEEIQRRIDEIQNEPEHHRSEEDRLIAVLVRENWQARDILDYARKQFGKKYDIQTETGGDLYQTEPALDMLTLCQALQKDDPAVLSHFVQSNLINGHVSKAKMQQLQGQQQEPGKKKPQVEYLHEIINQRLAVTAKPDDCRTLDDIREKLRMMPVMQVLHQIYMQLTPWENVSDSRIYRLNVDELFERFVKSDISKGTNLDQMTSYLENCIFSKKEAESRHTDPLEDQRAYTIKCLTVHKSKGLEYGYVILPFTNLSINLLKKTGMDVIIREDNHIGYNFRIGEDKTMQNSYFIEQEEKEEKMREETRILYVAMTRSRKGFSWIETEDNRKTSWQSLLAEGGAAQ